MSGEGPWTVGLSQWIWEAAASDDELGDDPGSKASSAGSRERFENRVLPLFVKRTRQVRELIPELYLHGLALGDFDLALRGLLADIPHINFGYEVRRPPCNE